MRKKLKHHAAERKPRQCGEAAANSVPPENSPKWTVSIGIGEEILLRKYICTQPQFQASPACVREKLKLKNTSEQFFMCASRGGPRVFSL